MNEQCLEELMKEMGATLGIIWASWVIEARKESYITIAWGIIHGFRLLLVGEAGVDSYREDLTFLLQLLQEQHLAYVQPLLILEHTNEQST